METITRESFSVSAMNKEDLLSILLKLNNETLESYASKMQTEPKAIKDNSIWAINSLSDLLDRSLIHLGYIAKDAKHEGVFGEYEEAVKDFTEYQSKTEHIQQPVTINKNFILSPVRTIRVSILSNAMNLLKERMGTGE